MVILKFHVLTLILYNHNKQSLEDKKTILCVEYWDGNEKQIIGSMITMLGKWSNKVTFNP